MTPPPPTPPHTDDDTAGLLTLVQGQMMAMAEATAAIGRIAVALGLVDQQLDMAVIALADDETSPIDVHMRRGALGLYDVAAQLDAELHETAHPHRPYLERAVDSLSTTYRAVCRGALFEVTVPLTAALEALKQAAEALESDPATPVPAPGAESDR